jgi:hypothetical protein
MTALIANQLLRLFSTKLLVEFGNKGTYAHDIDILIISDEFEGISSLKRKELIKGIDRSLDPICLTSRQFQILKDSNCNLFNCIKNDHLIIYGDKTIFF